MLTIPGFTAEVALESARRTYAASLAQFGDVGGPQISPQVFGWQPVPGCNPTCACISPIGCPCCIGPGPGGWLRQFGQLLK
jgi:hypothetical protein